jgi:uncharacterized protein DUF6064
LQNATLMPFTRDAFFAVFAAYNQAFWPVALALWLLSFVAVAGWVLGTPHGDSFLRFALGVNWLWGGVAYHAALFTRINPAAWLFAGLFVFQAAVFLTAGWSGRASVLRFEPRPRQAFAVGLLAYGLAYPAVVQAEGFAYPFAPTFGVPCPTTILTVGFLVAGKSSAAETIGPILWSLIGGSASFLFGVHADFVLLAAGVALGLDLLRRPLPHRGVML